MKRQITLEWEIRDTRKMDLGVYQLGTSTIIVDTKKNESPINSAIEFASNLPSWELERNNINDYRDGNICRYHYMTRITKIISVEIVK